MFDFPWSEGAKRVLRTLPFLLIRVAIYLGIAAAFVVAAGVGSGIGWGIGAIGGPAGHVPGAFWGMVAGLSLIGIILWSLREYLLFLVDAGHVAAMIRDPATAPARFGQIGHALSIVQQRFREARSLQAAEQQVRGTIDSLIEMAGVPQALIASSVSLPPAPVNAILRPALGFMSKVILAQALRVASKNPWPELRDALVLLAQNQTALLAKAATIAMLGYGATLAVFVLALLPASGLAASFPATPRAGTILLAAVFAWSFKQALVAPFAVALMVEEFSRTTRGQSPDERRAEVLARTSPQYREIEARATTRGGRPARYA